MVGAKKYLLNWWDQLLKYFWINDIIHYTFPLKEMAVNLSSWAIDPVAW